MVFGPPRIFGGSKVDLGLDIKTRASGVHVMAAGTKDSDG